MFIRDSLLLRNSISDKILIESNEVENWAAYISDLDGKEDLMDVVPLLDDVNLNRKFYEFILLMFYECGANFRKNFSEKFDDLRELILSMKLPF